MAALESLYHALFTPAPTQEGYLREYKRIIEEIESFGTDGDDDAANNRHVEESYMPDAEFFKYTGTVTHLYTDGKGGRIDNQYWFNQKAAKNLNLKVGDKVSCTARKLSEEQPIVIYMINSIDEDAWTADVREFDNIEPNDPIPMETYEKILSGGIVEKFNGEIAIRTAPKPIRLMISEIGCHFNPTVGDQVEVEVEFGINCKNPNEHTPIGYYGMKPVEEKTVIGKITTFKKRLEYGLIDDKYVFFMDVLQHSSNQNCVPNDGDMVISNVISSHQIVDDREFYFRCYNLTKYRGGSGAKTVAANEIDPIEESDEEIDDDICGLIISRNSELSVKLDAMQAKKRIELVVENPTERTHRISQAKFHNKLIESQIECKELYRYYNVLAGKRFVYGIEVTGKIRGLSKLKMDFMIDEKYLVRRTINIEVKTNEEYCGSRVTHSKAYTKKIYSEKCEVNKGRSPVDAPHFIDIRLERFEVPPQLFERTMTSSETFELDAKYADLFSKLNVKNYGEFFHALLYFEEILMRHEFRKYDQDRGHFTRAGEYLAYKMHKNVFECRPSIIIGDMIYAQSLIESDLTRDEPSQFQGFIHRIKKDQLLLKFSEEFHSKYLGEDYKIIFKFARTKFVKQHNAIERIAKKMKQNGFEFLFPNAIKKAKRLQMAVHLEDGEMMLEYPRQPIQWFNANLNEIQKRAVFNVLRGEVRILPYVVFGPPGTGKTSTLIEMILQLYRKGNTRLIVAAPSNSAANLITQRLAASGVLKAGQFVRIASQNSIERDQIPEELRIHCITADIAAPRSRAEPINPVENGIRVQCNSEQISTHRILISTCMTYGSLLCMKFKTGHFTHTIIDEAGQCTESEIAIPISLIDKDDGQIVLAGDPHQLGPVVLSPIAKKCGLAKSLLSRLLDHLPYRPDVGRDGGFDERLITQLLHNYRSLPSILATYSEMSYDSKLIANISDEDSAEIKLLENVQANIDPSAMLKHTAKYGAYFIGVLGKDETVPDSTSWRNPMEVHTVVYLVNQLYKCGLKEDDIGIITPYTLQAREMRLMCEDFFEGKIPKIGSVEEFQGQERNVIIISTVRSRLQNVSHDQQYGLGFVNNKNRLNVAISRARAMLVIVGNPHTLALDDNWRKLIYDCFTHGTYSGCVVHQQQLEQSE